MKKCPENLELIVAQDLKDHLSKKLSQKAKTIKIDLTETTRASVACIQLLIAAQKQAEENNKKLVLESNENFDRIIEQLGMKHLLNT